MARSNIAVYAAIAANVAIAVTKFVVAGITGSSAMLSEGIHSAVDTGNGTLLLVGRHLSQREASSDHPFGHGKEVYFWGLMTAVLIFGLGGGVSIYEGILHILHPPPLKDSQWSYIVLGLAALFEGASLAIALRQFARESGRTPFWRALHLSKDPTTYTVLAEDSVALMGLAAAACGIYFSHRFAMPVIDGAASVVIGLLLAGAAILLIRAARRLLIGQGVQKKTAEAIRRIALEHPAVKRAAWPLSMYIGPDEVLLTLDVEFKEKTPAARVAAAIRQIERRIRARFPKIKRIYIEARSIDTVTEARAESMTTA
jgi:cation diffusion facilitator family transporter